MTDDTTIDITRGLPSYFPKDENSPNYKLLSAIGEAIDNAEAELSSVSDQMDPETATEMAALREQGRLVNVFPRAGESIESYRERVLIAYKKLTSEGTIENLLEYISLLLGIDKTTITYIETDENGFALFDVPSDAPDNLNVSRQDFVNILDQSTAAGFRIGVQVSTGSFTYRSESDYLNTINDPDKGYDDHSTGTVEGGTYSSILNA
ncbi:YmfQ family protein [Halapricum desulfuricans]|uniref:Putative phage protein gp47/JayE n=1 Tax=Halapricum desulfuricans TaxID=2841257 RepID=A0A897N596_9EURY|nr:YmfQ family protein [Halapricum desulfuricans]QSG06413.1 putative phage protein gp47/JayE [Halapricum desulfuricans]